MRSRSGASTPASHPEQTGRFRPIADIPGRLAERACIGASTPADISFRSHGDSTTYNLRPIFADISSERVRCPWDSSALIGNCRVKEWYGMTERELEAAVPGLQPNSKRTILAVLLLAFVVVVVALAALAIHSYLAPSPTFR